MIRMLIPVALLLVGGTAAAQTAPVKQSAPAAAPIDPARLAAAERVVAQLVPSGIYQQMFDGVFNGMMDRMLGATGDLPLRQLAQMSGISEADAQALGDAKLHEVMDIYDPHWRERQSRMVKAFTAGMGGIMAKMEPMARAALSRAYAREFSLAELDDLNRYFATPVGAHYAARSLIIAMDPEMMKAMNELMPMMMAEMPQLIARAQAATKDLPPPRGKGDLSPAERKKLAELLGVDPETLEDPAS
jgi:hypothetical protein